MQTVIKHHNKKSKTATIKPQHIKAPFITNKFKIKVLEIHGENKPYKTRNITPKRKD